jgi:ABC-2 type transport system permease protein
MRINPLLAKELRLRMRTWRSFTVISLYLLVLGGIGLFFFAGFTSALRYGYEDPSFVGRNLFTALACLQFALIFFLVPGLTANVISGERERQTFELLVCTQLTPWNIVWGKLAAALSTVVLLILASLPLYSVVFLLGGVAPAELAILMAILLLTAFHYGSYALFFSAIFQRSSLAVLASYALALFLSGGTLMLNAIYTMIVRNRGGGFPLYYLLLFNPGALLEWLFPEPARQLLSDLIRVISGGGTPGSGYPFSGGLSWLKFWHISLLAHFLLAFAALWGASRLVNPLRAGRTSRRLSGKERTF